MLKISKKKLTIYNTLFYGGLLAGIFGAFFMAVIQHLGLYLMLLGGIVALIGGNLKDNMYRCPTCKTKLLVTGSRIDILLTKIPSYCPACGAKIDIVSTK